MKLVTSVNQAINDGIRKYHFYTLWKHNAPRSEFYRICNAIREDMDVLLFTREAFEEGWSYRTVLAPDYRVARREFFNLVFGWW